MDRQASALYADCFDMNNSGCTHEKKKEEEEGLVAQESRIRGKIDSGITGNYITVYY